MDKRDQGAKDVIWSIHKSMDAFSVVVFPQPKGVEVN
jgi:hypothetical protein